MIGNVLLCTFKKDYEKKSFCGGVPLSDHSAVLQQIL